MRVEYLGFLSLIKMLLIALGFVLFVLSPKDGLCVIGFIPALIIEISVMMLCFGNSHKNIILE